jgi:hypothetical protein
LRVVFDNLKEKIMYQWEKQAKESRQAYEAFCLYRESGEKIAPDNFAENSNSESENINSWRKKWNWEERREMFLDYVARFACGGDEGRAVGAGSESKDLLKLIISIINRKISDNQSDLEQLKLDELIKLAASYSKTMSDVGKYVGQDPAPSDDTEARREIACDDEALRMANELLSRLSNGESS